jgi:Leucine-rich repeat (LRR) protein
MKTRECKVNSINDICKCRVDDDAIYVKRPDILDKPILAVADTTGKAVAGIGNVFGQIVSTWNMYSPLKIGIPASPPPAPVKEVPSCLMQQQYPYTTKLGLYGGKIASLNDLNNFPALRELDLGDNQLASFDANKVSPMVWKLNLDNNPLVDMKNLMRLKDLGFLSLKSIPGKPGAMLTWEDLAGIEVLQRLEEINLEGTKIDVSTNPIGNAFPSISNKKLKKADVINLKSVYRTIRGKEGTGVSGEFFQGNICGPHYHEKVGLLGKSEMLLNNLNLTAVPECVGYVENLPVLNLSNNNIQDLAQLQIIRDKDSVEKLGLANNGLTKVSLPGFNKLKALDASRNNITSMDDVNVAGDIEELNLSGNRIQSIPHVYSGLKGLDLSNNDLGGMSQQAVTGPSGEPIILPVNTVDVIDGIRDMNDLSSLNLTGNPKIKPVTCGKDYFHWVRPLTKKEVGKLRDGLKKGKCI